MYDVILLSDTAFLHEFARAAGAYHLSTVLRNKGFKILVIDFVSIMSLEQLEKVISKAMDNNTKMVGVSCSWLPTSTYNFETDTTGTELNTDGKSNEQWHLDSVAQILASGKIYKIREVLDKYGTHYKLIVGGAKTMEYADFDFDHVFVGHSENQIIDFLNSNSIYPEIPRIINYDRQAKNGEFVFNRSYISYVDSDGIHPDEILSLETSRGCIFNCAFCSYPHKNQKTLDYMKCEETLYRELMENYERWGTTRYNIVDDTFNDYTNKLVRIKNVVDRLPFKPKFWAYIRCDLIAAHPEQAQLIKDIGVKSAIHGFETYSNVTSKAIRKGSVEKKIEGMRIAKKVWQDEVFLACMYVVGLPKDNVKDHLDFIDFWKNEGHKFIDNVTAFPFYIKNCGKYSDLFNPSDIEKEKEKYGYEMVGYKNWIRNDEGDIDSWEKAALIAEHINEKCKWKKENNVWNWHPYAARLGTYDPRTGAIGQTEVRAEVTKKWFDEQYYPNLLKCLDGL